MQQQDPSPKSGTEAQAVSASGTADDILSRGRVLLDDDDNVRDIPEKTAAADARPGGSVPPKRKMEPQDIEATAGTAVPFPSMDTDEQQLVQMIGKLALQHAWAVHEALARTMLQVCKVEVTLNKIRTY